MPAKLGTPDQPTVGGDLRDGYTVSWNAIPNASDYRLQWRTQGSTEWSSDDEARTSGATSHILMLPPLSQGTTYELQVQALSGDLVHFVDSEFSATATQIVPPNWTRPISPPSSVLPSPGTPSPTPPTTACNGASRAVPRGPMMMC